MAADSQEQQVITSVEDLNQPLRARVDAVEEANQRALDKAERERDRAVQALREFLETKLQAKEQELTQRIAALQQLEEQYHREQKYALEVASSERQNAAVALREEVNRAAQVLRESTAREISSGDEHLRQHINHNAEQMAMQIAAQKEAIVKAEGAIEQRFQSYDQLWTEVRRARNDTIQREVFEQDRADNRRRQENMMELINAQSGRITEIEARGGGEKDHAADMRSKLALGVAFLSPIAAVVATAVVSVFISGAGP